MNIVCFEDNAFYAIIEQVYDRLKNDSIAVPNKWISGEEAMRLLNIKSKTTLQNLRDTGKIRYTQPQKKVLLYDRTSINEYLEKYAQKSF